MPYLLVIKGPNVGDRYLLGDCTSLGRSAENDIQVFDSDVSRHHCVIVRADGGFELRDCDSKNGLLVNGKKKTAHLLRPKDEITVGSSVFLFDPDFELVDSRFSDKRIRMASPTDETIVRVNGAADAGGIVREEEVVSRRFAGITELLCHLGLLFSSARLPLPEALEKILQNLLHFFHAERGSLLIWDSVSSEFVPMVTISDEEVLSVSKNLIHQVLDEKKAILSSGGAGHCDLCVPLVGETQIMGLLYLEMVREDQFLLRDVNLLQAVANLTRLAIEQCQELDRLEIGKSGKPSDIPAIGRSAKFKEVRELIAKVAPTDSTVLLTGETGTGKEVAAREIHAKSRRASYPFLAINCAAIPELLLENELFGHEKGAFTGADRMTRGLVEQAHGGTLFLDEIGEMPQSAQVKVLRFLQDHSFQRIGGTQTIKVDVRIIAATNQNLQEVVREGKFRQDLYYRIQVFEIALPALRERLEDIEPLAESFLKEYSRSYRKTILGISPQGLRSLETYRWPGNIRELKNCMERAVLLCESTAIEPRHLMLPGHEEGKVHVEKIVSPLSLHDAVETRIREAMEQSGGNQIQAAKALGIHRNTLRKKIREMKLFQRKGH